MSKQSLFLNDVHIERYIWKNGKKKTHRVSSCPSEYRTFFNFLIGAITLKPKFLFFNLVITVNITQRTFQYFTVTVTQYVFIISSYIYHYTYETP